MEVGEGSRRAKARKRRGSREGGQRSPHRPPPSRTRRRAASVQGLTQPRSPAMRPVGGRGRPIAVSIIDLFMGFEYWDSATRPGLSHRAGDRTGGEGRRSEPPPTPARSCALRDDPGAAVQQHAPQAGTWETRADVRRTAHSERLRACPTESPPKLPLQNNPEEKRCHGSTSPSPPYGRENRSRLNEGAGRPPLPNPGDHSDPQCRRL